ncbi:partial ATP-binding/permease protein CydD, partial [Anaerolineae bacterium]
MKLARRLLAQLHSARTDLALTIALGVIGGGVGVAQASLLSQIIAQVFLRGATLTAVWNSMLIILALIGVRAVLAWSGEVSAFQIAARLKQNLRARVFAHLFDLGPTYVRGERTGELTHVVSEGIEALEAYFSQYLPQLALAALVPLLILALVFPLDWLSAVVLLATGPLIPLFMILIGQAANALTRQQYRELGALSAHFLDVLQGLATLKIFGRSREEIATLTRVGERYRDVTLRVLRVAFLSAFALEMIATLGTAIVAVQVGVRLLYGQLQFEQAFFVLLVAPDFYLPLRLLGTRFHAGMAGTAAAERIFQILDTPATQIAQPGSRSFTATRQALPRVSFHDVSFTYPGNRTALNGVSFEIEPGQRVALVGATGAGKTTVANLLLHFITPTRGEIFFDGVVLDVTARRQIAWVPQLPYLFNTSIAENICLARPHA